MQMSTKRKLWAFSSFILSLLSLYLLIIGLLSLDAVLGVGSYILILGLAVIIDAKLVFPIGMERLDLEPPEWVQEAGTDG